MKIVIAAFGSRGDIQPFLALAVALRARGHHVTLAAPADFEVQINTYAIPYLQIPINSRQFLDQDIGEQIGNRGITPATLLALWREVIPAMRRSLRTAAHLLEEAARDADLLIAHGFLIPLTYSIHQHLRLPLMLGIAAPVVATHQYPSAMFPPIPFGQRWYNPLTYDWLTRVVTSFMIEPMNAYRKSVNLPTLPAGRVVQLLTRAQFPILMHYSRHLSPPPADWSANAQVVGAWTLPAPPDWTPPDALSAFLAQGEAPIYFGFGSMPVPKNLSQTISEALRLAGLRGVLQEGWSRLSHSAEHLITIDDMPHDWLFARMAAVVHHGGSGTTHAAVRAGKPTLIVPFMADQPFWGRRIAELGAGVPPIPPKRLTTARLADALRVLTQDSAMRQRAAALGELVRAEDGLTVACDLIEQHVRTYLKS